MNWKNIKAQKKEGIHPEDVRPLTKKQAKILKKKIEKIGLPGNHDMYTEQEERQ